MREVQGRLEMSWNEIVEGFVLPLTLLSSLCFLSLPCKIVVQLEQRESYAPQHLTFLGIQSG